MKLRIRGNAIRLRLLRSEVAALVETGIVEEATEFGSGQRFEYALRTSADLPRPCATYRAGRIEVLLPTQLARDWAAGPEVGITAEQRLARGGEESGGEPAQPLTLLIEKDFVCVNPRPDEDQSDAFPQPGQSAMRRG